MIDVHIIYKSLRPIYTLGFIYSYFNILDFIYIIIRIFKLCLPDYF